MGYHPAKGATIHRRKLWEPQSDRVVCRRLGSESYHKNELRQLARPLSTEVLRSYDHRFGHIISSNPIARTTVRDFRGLQCPTQ
jgi:hypothetical protein